MLTMNIKYNDHSLTAIDRDGKPWFTAEIIGQHLGYASSNTRKGILKLYERHSDEFSGADVAVVKLGTPGGTQDTRIFSLSGAIKLSTFASTKTGKKFRQWAWAELMKIIEQGQQASEIRTTFQPSYTASIEQALDHTQRELLAARPMWANILRYLDMGHSRAEISLLIQRNKNTLRKYIRRMEACGILEPPRNLHQLRKRSLHLPSVRRANWLLVN